MSGIKGLSLRDKEVMFGCGVLRLGKVGVQRRRRRWWRWVFACFVVRFGGAFMCRFLGCFFFPPLPRGFLALGKCPFPSVDRAKLRHVNYWARTLGPFSGPGLSLCWTISVFSCMVLTFIRKGDRAWIISKVQHSVQIT